MVNEQFSLLQLKQESQVLESQIKKRENDWVQQIELLKALVSKTNYWQKKIHSKFGTPDIRYYQATRGMDVIIRHYTIDESFLLPVTNFKPLITKYFGACLLQGIDKKEFWKEWKIRYSSELRTDENYFLAQMLPRNIEADPVQLKDPIYEISDFEFVIPKSQLVQESLFLLDEAFKETDQLPQKKKRFGVF